MGSMLPPCSQTSNTSQLTFEMLSGFIVVLCCLERHLGADAQ